MALRYWASAATWSCSSFWLMTLDASAFCTRVSRRAACCWRWAWACSRPAWCWRQTTKPPAIRRCACACSPRPPVACEFRPQEEMRPWSSRGAKQPARCEPTGLKSRTARSIGNCSTLSRVEMTSPAAYVIAAPHRQWNGHRALLISICLSPDTDPGAGAST